MGDSAGRFSLKGLSIGQRDRWDDGDGLDTGEGAELVDSGAKGWKERFLESERRVREQGEEIRRLKDKVLDAIL